MKKLILMLLLALCITLFVTPALAAPGDVSLMERLNNGDMQVDCVHAVGDTLYLVSEHIDALAPNLTLSAWHVGDAEPTLIASTPAAYGLVSKDGDDAIFIHYTFFHGDELWGFNSVYGMLERFQVQDGQLFPDAPLQLLGSPEEWQARMADMNFEDVLCVGDDLFFLVEDFSVDDGFRQLYSFNLNTLAGQVYQTPYICDICEYKDGKLLCQVTDEHHGFNESTLTQNPLKIAVFDPKSDALTEIGTLDVGVSPMALGGLAYDPNGDTLYITCPQAIYRMVNLGAPELCAYLPTNDYMTFYGQAMAYLDGMVAVNCAKAVYVRNVDPQFLPTESLVIYGYEDSIHTQVAAQLDTPITFLSPDVYFSTAQELGQALVSGEDQIDILRIDMNYMDFQRLMEKGYCADLSGSEALREFAESLYTFLQEGIERDGKLFAVPITMSANVMECNPAFDELNEQLGGALKLPATFSDLVDLYQAWGDENYYDDYSEYTIISASDIKQGLRNEALEMYVNYYAAMGEPLTLDTPLFREVMGQVDALDVSDWEMDSGSLRTEEDWDEFYSKKALLSEYREVDARDHSASTWRGAPLAITLSEDTPLVIPARVEAYFVNPRSQHIDAAIRYLEAYVAAMEPLEKTKMCPGLNEPIENDYYQVYLNQLDQQIAQVKAAMEIAAAVDQQALQEQLDTLQERRTAQQAANRYDATEQSIAAYREYAQYFFLQGPTLWDDSMYRLSERYLQGQIDLEQFIREGDEKLRLMQLEDQ